MQADRNKKPEASRERTERAGQGKEGRERKEKARKGKERKGKERHADSRSYWQIGQLRITEQPACSRYMVVLQG